MRRPDHSTNSVSSSSMMTEFGFNSIALGVDSSFACTTVGCLSRLGMNVAMEIQISTSTSIGVREFLTAMVNSSFSKADMYAQRKPVKKVISNRIEPTIARPTLTGILPNEAKTKLIIPDMFRLQNRKSRVNIARPKKLISIAWASSVVLMNIPSEGIPDN